MYNMNRKTLLGNPLTHCLASLIVGAIGITFINSVVAQPTVKNIPLPFEMAQASSLTGKWRLANMAESSLPTPMVPSEELTVNFSEGRISGSGGCNRFMGSYEVEGDRLTIGQLASTFKACEQPIMDQESRYLKALQGTQRYELDDQGQLTIYYQTDDESGVLRFVSQNVRGLW